MPFPLITHTFAHSLVLSHVFLWLPSSYPVSSWEGRGKERLQSELWPVHILVTGLSLSSALRCEFSLFCNLAQSIYLYVRKALMSSCSFHVGVSVSFLVLVVMWLCCSIVVPWDRSFNSLYNSAQSIYSYLKKTRMLSCLYLKVLLHFEV